MARSLSLVFPTYTRDKDLEKIEIDCISTFRDRATELIITEDGGLPSPELISIATSYIYNSDRIGFTGNVNRGWRFARGDYVAIINSDIRLVDGDLDNLCIPGRVTAPGGLAVVPGHFFVVPKEIKEQFGMLDESMKMWWSDTDYGRRVWHIYEPVPEVEVEHLGGSTHKREPDLINKYYHLDGAAYNEIWDKHKNAGRFLTKEEEDNYNRIQSIIDKYNKKRIQKRDEQLAANRTRVTNI